MNHLRLFVFKNIFACFSILLIFSISHAYGSEYQANSRQVTISAIENEQTHAIAKHILIEAYKHIDYQISFDDLPGKRALEWANNGLTDGDVARIEGTEKKFTNLIPIKIPIIHFQGVVFTKKLNKDITQWNDLKGLRIGVVRGIRYSTIGTEGMEPFFANDTRMATLKSPTCGRVKIPQRQNIKI